MQTCCVNANITGLVAAAAAHHWHFQLPLVSSPSTTVPSTTALTTVLTTASATTVPLLSALLLTPSKKQCELLCDPSSSGSNVYYKSRNQRGHCRLFVCIFGTSLEHVGHTCKPPKFINNRWQKAGEYVVVKQPRWQLEVSYGALTLP